MASVEKEIKSEFEKIFRERDWTLFKTGADYYLNSAAFLKKDDIKLLPNQTNNKKDIRLLFRNIQKRLWIGVACEFLIKAYFLKSGFVINKLEDRKLKLINFKDLENCKLKPEDTFTFSQLIDLLSKLEKIKRKTKQNKIPNDIIIGLKIAKVFRNKEAHSIIDTHIYNKKNYKIIEDCVIYLYKNWFDEELKFKISFAKNEKSEFKISI